MSIVVVIAGVISTFMLDIFSVASKISKSKLNNQKIEEIEKAFYAFIIKNNRYMNIFFIIEVKFLVLHKP